MQLDLEGKTQQTEGKSDDGRSDADPSSKRVAYEGRLTSCVETNLSNPKLHGLYRETQGQDRTVQSDSRQVYHGPT